MEFAACAFALSWRNLPFVEFAGEFCGLAACRSSTTRQSSICFGSGQITSALWISQTPQDCVGERGSTGVWEVTGPESKPAHECLRWPRPAHLRLCWSCPAHLRWSHPARLRLCWFPSAAASPCFPSTAESHCHYSLFCPMLPVDYCKCHVSNLFGCSSPCSCVSSVRHPLNTLFVTSSSPRSWLPRAAP